MKRILITGGAGFLGSHLCERLLNEGNEVICMDNYFTGFKSNIAHLRNHPNFELLRHDVIDPFKIETDQIYNLACPASPPHYQYNAIKTIKTSVMVLSTALVQRSEPSHVCFRPPHRRFMVILRCTHSRRAIGAMLILLVFVHAMMKASVQRRPYSWIITDKMAST